MIKQLKFSLLTIWLLMGGLLTAQTEADYITNCLAFKNANVVIKPGQVLKNTHVIIRNGVIIDVGQNAVIPFDAKVINADSMWIYAGFIAPVSNIAIKEDDKDKDKKESKPSSPGMATLSQAGFTPQSDAFDLLSANSGSIESFRKEGFVVAHTLPKGYPVAGQGSIISLKKSDNKDDLLIKRQVSNSFQLKTNRGVFPSTLIGAMSKFRELYKNTEYYLNNQKNYQLSPLGMKRPEVVSEYEAFSKVTQKQIPLYFTAQKPKDIQRAIALQKELGYRMVLTEVEHIAPIISLVNKQTPILLSLKLPKEIKADEKKDSTKAKIEEISAEDKAKEERRKLAYEEIMGQGSILVKQGYNLSFSYLEVKSNDIHKNIQRLIKSGISSDQALASLTTNPASILQIDNIYGTIEKGKVGSVVISDKPIFDEKSKIKYVVVDGQLYDYISEEKSDKKKTEGNDDEMPDLAGTWRINVSVPDGDQGGNLFIEGGKDNLDIGFEADDDPANVIKAKDIEVDGKNLTFMMTVPTDEGSMDVKFSINFDSKDTGKGSATIAEFGSFPLTADKRMRPDKSIK